MPHHEIPGIPSVTQVLGILDKPFLLPWYAKNGWAKCEAIKKESQVFGSSVHDAIEGILTGKESTYPDEVMRLRQQFKDWLSTQQLEPVLIEPEAPLISTLGFQGTPDAIVKLNGCLTVCDWKTSSAIDDVYGLQLAAYAKLYEENRGEFPDYGLILQINKKGKKAKERHWDNLKELWPVFEALLKVYKWKNAH